jgi:hypothetical protein
MQFEPPTKEADVTVNVADGDSSSQGVDSNGIVTGRWKTGIFGFTDSMVPNGKDPLMDALVYKLLC